jgi:hypothetical protein
MRRRKLPLFAALLTAMAIAALVAGSAALAFDSGGNPSDYPGDNTVQWTGQGASGGKLNTEQCDESNTPYLLWVFTTDGGSASDAKLHLGTTDGGNELGDFSADTNTGNTFKFVTPYYTPDPSTLFAYVDFTVITNGNGGWNLVISHGCPGGRPPAANLTVSKDANGSYDDTFEWKLDKSVDTNKVFSAGGGESGKVNYTVTVSHGESQDSNYQVTGTITIGNPNDASAIVHSLGDQLSDDTICAVDEFEGEIAAHGTENVDFTCNLDGPPEGGLTNKVTITWEDQDLSDGSHLAAGSATFTTDPISFTANEIDTCVDVKDTLGGDLGNVCVGGDNPAKFNYSQTFEDPAGTCTSHDNTASFTTNDTGATGSDSETVTDCQGADLTVSKTAAGTYDRECTWDISKSANPLKQTVDVGAGATFSYTVKVSATCETIQNVKVSGTITISNPNDWEDITLTSLDDVLDSSGACTVDAGPYLVPAGKSIDVNYTCSSASLNDTKNTATAKWDKDAYHTPTGEASGSADVKFTEKLIDNCVDVSDAVDGGTPESLGSFCVDASGGSKTFEYARTFKGPAAGTCADHNNTASFVDNSDPVHKGSASAKVTVCSYNALTIGYWKTHEYRCAPGEKTGHNGCNNNGPFTVQYLPQLLGSYNVNSPALALAVFNANNCSNASTSDSNAIACLAAQLLAAKLNVAAFGGSCITATITAADAFLAAVGYNGPGTGTLNATHTRAQAIALKDALDKYNNGLGC